MPISGPKISIVFFGSGPVAAASLELLLSDFDIECVITKPRPPHHHGSVPVLELAQKHSLPTVESNSKKELSQAISNKQFTSKIAILIDFGIIVAQDVIDAFPLGIINSHFSLLPEWRGADPITFAILSGQERTGVSLMKLVVAMDEGPIVAIGVQPLDDSFTTPILTEKLIQLSYALLKDELPRYIEAGGAVEQEALPELITDFPYPDVPTYSRKLTKADSILDFSKPAEQLEREIRAYADWPKSRTVIAGKDVVILEAHVDHNLSDEIPKVMVGKPIIIDKQLCITTSSGVLVIDLLKPAGKSTMPTPAFLAGYGKNL